MSKNSTTDVFIAADNILSPLGYTTAVNFARLRENISGIKLQDNSVIADAPFYASLFEHNDPYVNNGDKAFTKFEQLLIASISHALAGCAADAEDERTLLIISSTKGNISLLETMNKTKELQTRIALHTSAKLVAAHFGLVSKPVVVSNACISGLLGILTGLRFIRSGQYDNVIVAGADVISRFVLSGFQSFRAVSNDVCRPFDKERNGITLGEGAGTMILSSDRRYAGNIRVMSGATGNDANHISGPSRTGAELHQVIQNSLTDAGLRASDIDFISAHGTATIYNDEMEAKAIALAGMQAVPVNSLKGYYGHTLGAAGIIESVVTARSMLTDTIIPTRGFTGLGVSEQINVCDQLTHTSLNNCLKTASGFGGCNGAIIFSKT